MGSKRKIIAGIKIKDYTQALMDFGLLYVNL